MEWLRTHPYAAGLGAAGILIVAGTFIVVTKSSAPPGSSQAVAWGGTGTILNPSFTPGDSSPQNPPVGIMQQVQSGAPYTYIPPSVQPNPAGNTNDTGFDFNTFMAALSASTQSASAPAGTGGQTNAYAFIPSGMVSVAVPNKRTKLQDSIYTYGNNLGALIQSFEQAHPNETQVLTDQAQDRTDAGKAAAVVALGNALVALGDNILAMDGVPSEMVSTHQALAQSYSAIGQKLALVPKTQRDADFIAAVEAYNSSADTFTQNYVAMANLFVAYGVTFSPGDAGSIFTFSPTAL